MTVQAYKSTQRSGRKTSKEDLGKVRHITFEVVASADGDAASTAELCTLPQGAVRVLPHLSKVWCDAFGAARVMDIGHAAYTRVDGGTEAAVANAFANDIDVSAAASNVSLSSVRKFDVTSKDGVVVTAQIAGGTWPSTKGIYGYIAVLMD